MPRNFLKSHLLSPYYWWKSREISLTAASFVGSEQENDIRTYEVNSNFSASKKLPLHARANLGDLEALREAAKTDNAIHIRLLSSGSRDNISSSKSSGYHWTVEIQNGHDRIAIDPIREGLQKDSSSCGPWSLKIASKVAERFASFGKEGFASLNTVKSDVVSSLKREGATDKSVRTQMANAYETYVASAEHAVRPVRVHSNSNAQINDDAELARKLQEQFDKEAQEALDRQYAEKLQARYTAENNRIKAQREAQIKADETFARKLQEQELRSVKRSIRPDALANNTEAFRGTIKKILAESAKQLEADKTGRAHHFGRSRHNTGAITIY